MTPAPAAAAITGMNPRIFVASEAFSPAPLRLSAGSAAYRPSKRVGPRAVLAEGLELVERRQAVVALRLAERKGASAGAWLLRRATEGETGGIHSYPCLVASPS